MPHLARRIVLAVTLVAAAGGGVAIGLAIGLSTVPAAAGPTCSISWNNSTGGNWTTAADWTAAGGGTRVPTTSDDVCITVPGTYTVVLTGAVSVNSLTVGNTPANPGDDESLTVASGASLSLGSGSTDTIGADGTLLVGDTTPSASSSVLSAPTTATLTNNGTLEFVQGGGGARYLRVDVDNVGTTTIGSGAAYSDGSTGATAFTNSGTLAIAPGANYVLEGGASFIDSGGTVSNGGTLEQSGGTFVARGGSETGTPVSIVDATLDDDTSAGPGQFVFTGHSTLTGSGPDPGISAGQILTIASANAQVTMAESLTNNGTLDVGDTTPGTLISVLTAPAPATLTNNGTLDSVEGGGGDRFLRVDIDNAGTTTIRSGATYSDGAFGPTVFTNTGTLTIASGGSYTFDGGASFVAGMAGTVAFHIASATAFGSISATGSTLAGTADPIPDGGYSPPAATEFDVVRDTSYKGCFTGVDSGFRVDCTNARFPGVGLVVGVPQATTTALGAASPNPSTYGRPVTLTAVVSQTDGRGTVSFTSNGATIAGCGSQPLNLVLALSAWQASCTTSALTGGTDSIGASYSGDDGYAPSNAVPVTQTVVPAKPTVTWATPTPLTYGTALRAAQLDASASVPGTFDYHPGAGTVLTAGSHLLSVTFTPTDTADYTTSTGTVTMQVDQATPRITWPTPAPVRVGTPLSATQLDATASVPGSFVYDPGAGTVLHPGANQILSVTFTPVDTTDYSGTTARTTLTVTARPSTSRHAISAPACPSSSPRLGVSSAQSCASGSSTSAASTGKRGTITVTAHGSGAITVDQYGRDPSGGLPFTSSGAPFEVALSDGNTFTSVSVEDCALNGATRLLWYKPVADDGVAGWKTVTPAAYVAADRSGTITRPACLTFALSSTSSPALDEVTGTVFDGALAAVNISVSIGGATPYSISGPVLAGSVTISSGLLHHVRGNVVVAGPHGKPVAIKLDETCVFGACFGTISVTDPVPGTTHPVPGTTHPVSGTTHPDSGLTDPAPSSRGHGGIQADQARSEGGEGLSGHGGPPYVVSWSVTVMSTPG